MGAGSSFYFSERAHDVNCPKCGSRWKVSDSRHADSPEVSRRVAKAVSWYTSDWVARKRKCGKCGLLKKTIEVSLEDLEEMLKETAREHGLPPAEGSPPDS